MNGRVLAESKPCRVEAGQARSSPGHHDRSPPILPRSSACSDPRPLAIQGQSPCAARLQAAQAPWPRLCHTYCATQRGLKALTCGLAARAGPPSYGVKWLSGVRTPRARNGGTANDMCTSLSRTSRCLKPGCGRREHQAQWPRFDLAPRQRAEEHPSSSGPRLEGDWRPFSQTRRAPLDDVSGEP